MRRRTRHPWATLGAAFALVSGIVPIALAIDAPVASAATPTSDAVVSVGRITVPEGDVGTRILRVPVTLDAPAGSPVTVAWSLTGVDGAVAGAPSAAAVDADFRAASGTLTFARGVVTRSINVAVYGDTRVESDESIDIVATPASAATTIGASGGVTLQDDDGSATATVTAGSVRVVEGAARVRTVSVPLVLRSATAGASATVRVVAGSATGGWTGAGVAPAGVDVGDRSGATRTILFGTSTVRYLTVAVAPDLDAEGDETFTVQVVAASAGLTPVDGTGTIVDDDTSDDPASMTFGPSPTPVGTVAPGSTLVGCASAATRITVTASTHLDPTCTYTRGIDVGTSNVTLDCRGASVTRGVGVTDSMGIRIAAPTTTALHDITIRNCAVSGFDNDLRITRNGFKDLAVGSEYDNAFAAILVEHSSFVESRNSGVFIDGFVTGVTMSHTLVDHAGAVGIYLEAGSRGTTIEHSTVTDSGYKDIDAGPQTVDFGTSTVHYVSTGREGISVDGSSGNTIRGNYIARNAYGGVFLYKNCGENTSKPGHWVRNHGSTDNAIVGNVIEDEPHGVWVASRASENQYFMDCSDTPLVANPGGLQLVYLDPVVGTAVEFNRIRRTPNAIRVEGDQTVVRGNVVDGSTNGIQLGTHFRTTVGSTPVSGTSVLWNTARSTTTPYSWIWGHSGTTFTGNVGGTTPGRLVTGSQPGTGPFLMVDHFV